MELGKARICISIVTRTTNYDKDDSVFSERFSSGSGNKLDGKMERHDVWRRTCADVQFLLPELPFCRQPCGDHKSAFSAPQREQHVCLGEQNKPLSSRFDTINSGLVFLTKTWPAKLYLSTLTLLNKYVFSATPKP